MCTINLFNNLTGTPQGGGSWTGTGVSAAGYSPGTGATTATFDPTAYAVANGPITTPVTLIFNYVINSGSCNATAQLTVNINPAPNAGANITINKCKTDTAFNVFTPLGATSTGGSWVPMASWPPGVGPGNDGPASGGFVPGGAGVSDDQFNPSHASVTPGTYIFHYSVTTPTNSVPPCADCTDSATVTVIVADQPNAGAANTINVCA